MSDLWIGPGKCLNGSDHEIRDAVMSEDGIDHPVKVCNKCGNWG